jgi:endonuclease/exonuclease/phosphatase (EEP) superfamily protein YafD
VLSVGSGVAVVAVWAVVVVGRELAAPPAWIAGAVVFLPYLFLLVAVVLFTTWTLAPDRRTPPLALAALSLTAAWLWVPGRSVAPEDPAAGQVRVLSWNLQRLWGPDQARACVVEHLTRESPDVLALLEVSRRDVDSLAAELGLDCRHHPYTSATGQNRGGLATCSRRDGPWALTGGDAARFVDDEDWYYQLAEFASGTRRFNLLVAHLYPYRGVAQRLVRGVTDGDPASLAEATDRGEAVSRGQSDQAAALLERVQTLRDPTVVAGDFNSTPDAALHVALRRHLVDTWSAAGAGFGGTVHLFGLPLRVDYVYASRSFGVRAARVVAAGCSDHEPVVAELQLP